MTAQGMAARRAETAGLRARRVATIAIIIAGMLAVSSCQSIYCMVSAHEYGRCQ